MAKILTGTVERRATTEGKRLFKRLQNYVAANRRIPANWDEELTDFFVSTALFGMSAGRSKVRAEYADYFEFAFEPEIFREIPIEQYDGLSAYLATGVRSLTETLQRRIEFALQFVINELYGQNITFQEAYRLVRKRLAEVGASTSNFYRVENLIVTAVQETHNTQLYNAAFNSPIYDHLWGFRYVTAGDEDVRPNHEAQQGVTLPKDHDFWQVWWPPNGYNCRCEVEFLFKPAKIVEPDDEFSPDPDFASISPFFGLSRENNVRF